MCFPLRKAACLAGSLFVACTWLVEFDMLIGLSPAVAREPSQMIPKVRGDVPNARFVKDDGTPYIPFGVNYFRPGTGWAPQVWKRFDAEAVRADFHLMKAYGVNCVRVFLTFGSFYQERGELSEEGLIKWEQFLNIAEESGIYVHPTGPDHWEGLPAWARGDTISQDDILEALCQFWRLFAARNRGRSIIFAYDLRNEPSVPWDTPYLRQRWNQHLSKKYQTAENLASTWQVPLEQLRWGEQPVPDPATPSPALLDYQLFREEIADQWTRRQAVAIKSADPEALVTVGLIQWSVPVLLPDLRTYSAFRPARQAQYLDFMEIHFYPLARGFYDYQRPEDHAANLAYLESVVREVAATGKPVLVAEFGWYGGGKLTISGGRHPPATEEHQASWCVDLIRTTKELACGWLNWGLYDHPEAGDVTQLTGLFTADGRPKKWAMQFKVLSQEVPHFSCSRFQEWEKRHRRPQLDWSRAIIDASYAAEYRREYLKLFEAK